jgi:hypothetical protein
MVRIDRATTTESTHWQTECSAWARAREPFELRSVAPSHLSFCRELSLAYKLKVLCSPPDNRIQFMPE